MGNYINYKSFQLIRTNTKLTTNLKINIDTDLNLYLESFNTNKQLSDDKYKHFSLPNEKYLEDMIHIFYDKLPSNLAFDVKYNSDEDIIYKKFANQFDDLYWSGVKKIEENKFYKEEFEYFAPLYIKEKELPTTFIILRVDDLGVYDENDSYKLISTNAGNFRPEIINKWKCVTDFDLTTKSKLGYWLNNNFTNNERFPSTPFEFDSNSNNFSRWCGIDYLAGSYTEKSRFLSDKIRYEQPHFKFEEYVTDGYKDNNLIFPNILNLNYLFDDNPATPFKYKKYSLNRYFGFYVDLEKVETLTSYNAQPLRQVSPSFPGLKIINNIFMEVNTLSGSINPFFETDAQWDENGQYYIYVIDDLFEVTRIKNGSEYSYNILSEYDVKIEDITNDKEIDIEFIEETNFDYQNKIKMRNNNILMIDDYLTETGFEYMKADLYLIEIDKKLHILELDENNDYLIRTDYAINSNENILKYWIANENDATINIVHDKINKNKPLLYEIFKVKFRDIKDFDFNRIDTGFADFDFDQEDEYIKTEEHKLYCVDYTKSDINTVFKNYDLLSNYWPNRIIASSEYVADDELYELTKNGLSGLWDKNQSIAKWGYVGSISHADYSYKLNNSNKIGSLFNKTTNTLSNIPDVVSKTNDYFYRIGTFIEGNNTGYDFEYKHFKTQSLSIETETKKEQQFNLDIYLDADVDYFDYFFNNIRYINDDEDYVEAQQFSVFNNGSKYNLSSTLFKGIKYEILRIDDVIKTGGVIDKYLANKTDFNQYKFSVIANYRQNYYTGNTAYNGQKNAIIDNRIKEYPWDSVKSTKADLSDDGIHVILNNKYKNVLVIVNMKGVVEPYTLSLNNLSYYDKEVIYNRKGITALSAYQTEFNITLATANMFMSELNENLINYYYIDDVGDSGHTLNINTSAQTSTMQDIPSWGNDFSPFKLQSLYVDELRTKKQSFKVEALKGPKTNIYDQYKTDFSTPQYDDEFIKDPLARKITLNEKEINPRAQVHGETLLYDNVIFRYDGAFEPIFKNISLFKPTDYLIVDPQNIYQKKNATIYDGFLWHESTVVCDDNFGFSNIYHHPGDTSTDSNPLYLSGFNFSIDSDVTIKGIKVYMKRKAADGPVTAPAPPPFYSGIADKIIQFPGGDNKAILNTYNDSGILFSDDIADSAQTNFWLKDKHTQIYGSETDMWGRSWTPDLINSHNFRLVVQTTLYALSSTPFLINQMFIDCVEIEVFYALSGSTDIQSTTLERNINFDTEYSNFGELDNLIFSKVNEKNDILKLKDTKEDKSVYPMVDEYGYQYDKRFIFKSSWDSDYYIRTKNELDN